jgi:hypothetical protein
MLKKRRKPEEIVRKLRLLDLLEQFEVAQIHLV